MASSDESNDSVKSSLGEFGSPGDNNSIGKATDWESVSSPTNISVETSETSCNHQYVMNLVRLNSELSASVVNLGEQKLEKDIQIGELKLEKAELKQEIRELQKKNETLNDQMHEMRERHITEINKFHERNMSSNCEAKVLLNWNKS